MTWPHKRHGPDALERTEAANHNRRIRHSTALSGYRALAGETSGRSSVDVILGRLDGVRRSGRGWVAKCPAHADRSPSLSIAEGDEGRTLVKCFAGCHVTDVLAALGLDLQDLFPERVRDLSPLGRAQRREALRVSDVTAASAVLALESLVVLIAANDTAQGKALDDVDRTRLAQAADTIQAVRLVIEDKTDERNKPIDSRHYERMAAALHRGAEQAADLRARIKARFKGEVE
jgi:DNA primase